MANENKLRHIPIAQIRERPDALRAVNKDTEEFRGLVDSIRDNGVINAITVREAKDKDTGAKYFSLVDGLHRFTAAGEAGLFEIPAQILDVDDAKAHEIQLMANLHKVETKPMEYTKLLTRILGNHPTMTQAELAKTLSVSPTWLGQRMGLLKLDKRIGELVDAGTINLSNAYVLAKLPPEEQGNFVDRAMTMGTGEFAGQVNARQKELRDARREGRAAQPTEFVPVPHIRKISELKQELDKPEILPLIVREGNLNTPAAIIRATLEWALHLDKHSVDAARAKDEARKRQAEEDKAARKKEREERKAAAAAATQAAITG